jgi:ribosomal protein S1
MGDVSMNLYREYLENKTVFQVTITHADHQGNLYFPISDTIKGILSNEDVATGGYDQRKRAKFVGRKFGVMVTKVEESTNTVYVSYIQAKAHVKAHFKNTLKLGDEVRARVLSLDVEKRQVYLDIEGCGLFGFMGLKYWSHGKIYSPQKAIKRFDTVTVKIMDILPSKHGQESMYICNRKDCIPDPWKGIEERFPKNSIILVTCMDIYPDKWFAPAPGTDLDIYCEYPRDNSMMIKLGHQYKVRIYNVSEEKKVLKARPIQEVENSF